MKRYNKVLDNLHDHEYLFNGAFSRWRIKVDESELEHGKTVLKAVKEEGGTEVERGKTGR